MNIKDSVPIIECPPGADFGPAALRDLDQACAGSGFFYLANHGLDELLEEVWEQTRWFFSQPPAFKRSVARSEENSRGFYDRELTKNARDMKEVFDFGALVDPDKAPDDAVNRTQDGWNQWPGEPGGARFRQVMERYFNACQAVGLTLLRQLTRNLDEQPDYLVGDFHPENSSFLRLNYYPLVDPLAGGDATQRADSTGHMGVHHHTDAGALTLLLQDQVGGLQIHHDGKWIDVPPVSDTLVVNIGDIVQVWSNDRYPAPLHRVVASSRADRYSLPFFLNPQYSASYAPLPAQVTPDRPAAYRPINWGQFRFERQHGDYGDYGQEIQIADFRTTAGL